MMILNFIKADLRQKNLMFWDWVFPFILMIGATFFIGNQANVGDVLGGLIAFLMLQSLIYGFPYRISEYQERGTLQLIAEEGNIIKFIGSFLTARIIIVFIQCLLFIPIGALIMGGHLDIHLGHLLITFISSLIILGGFSLLIGVSVNTQQSALGASQLFYLLFSITSGIFYPLEKSPKLLQQIARFSPLTYVRGLFTISISNFTIVDTNPMLTSLIICMLGLLFIGISIYILRKKLNHRNQYR